MAKKTTKKRGRGHPPTGRTRGLLVRLSPRVDRALRKRAEAEGLSLAALVEEILGESLL